MTHYDKQGREVIFIGETTPEPTTKCEVIFVGEEEPVTEQKTPEEFGRWVDEKLKGKTKQEVRDIINRLIKTFDPEAES